MREEIKSFMEFFETLKQSERKIVIKALRGRNDIIELEEHEKLKEEEENQGWESDPNHPKMKAYIVSMYINNLSENIGKEIPIESVILKAEKDNITKIEVLEIIEKLKRSGDIYQPKKDYIEKV